MSKSIEVRALEWAGGDDTGASSMTIYRHMLGLPQNVRFGASEPADGGDLGRCCRLLELIPEWKPRIHEMAILSHAWAALIPHWDELTKLLASEAGPAFDRYGQAPKTYERMKSITAEARSKDGWISVRPGFSIRAS